MGVEVQPMALVEETFESLRRRIAGIARKTSVDNRLIL